MKYTLNKLSFIRCSSRSLIMIQTQQSTNHNPTTSTARTITNRWKLRMLTLTFMGSHTTTMMVPILNSRLKISLGTIFMRSSSLSMLRTSTGQIRRCINNQQKSSFMARGSSILPTLKGLRSSLLSSSCPRGLHLRSKRGRSSLWCSIPRRQTLQLKKCLREGLRSTQASRSSSPHRKGLLTRTRERDLVQRGRPGLSRRRLPSRRSDSVSCAIAQG
mmetsp:Transcript_13341/g.20837  ORF Transcript_13341/g.20837 Transcript_13341/m.20837 type:complete len:217 (+) Transcript_13341:729-1379(+)